MVVVPEQQPDHDAGQPRRRAPAGPRRQGRAAHRARSCPTCGSTPAAGSGSRSTLGKTDADSTEELVERYALIAGDPEGPETRIREDLGALLGGLGCSAGPPWPLVPLARVGGGRARRGGASSAPGLWRAAAARGRRASSSSVDRAAHPAVAGRARDPRVRGGVDPAAGVPRRPGRGARGARRGRGAGRRHHQPDPAAHRERDRHLREQPHVLPRRPPRRPASSTCASPRRARRSRCWSPTGTTTSAWTRSPARSPTGPARPRCSTPATTPRPASRGRRSPSTRSWRRSTTRPTTTRRWAVAGNHDNGTFVSGHLADHGWTVLDGEVVEGPGGGPMLGVADPRSSGLGNWRDETGLTFEEVADRLADAACAAAEDGERISTLLVHDANLGDPTLERGLRRPGPRRPPARPGRADRGAGRQRRGRLQLHDGHDRRRGVRHRAGQQAAARCRHQPRDLPGRAPGRAAVGPAADRRRVRRGRLPDPRRDLRDDPASESLPGPFGLLGSSPAGCNRRHLSRGAVVDPGGTGTRSSSALVTHQTVHQWRVPCSVHA